METGEQTQTQKPAGSKIRPLHIGIVAVLIIIAAAAYFAFSASGQVVAVGDIINVSYTGSFTNGTVFGTNVGGQPLQFTVGANELIPGFDQAVVGMHVGQEKNVTLPENDAYGPVNPALIMEVPSNSFGNQTATVGMGVDTVIDGQELQGLVIAVNNTTVTTDFNPPLAGKTLVFDIKVLSIMQK